MTLSWKLAHRNGLFFALLFVLCFAWYWVNPTQQATHVQQLQLAFLGFSGMNGSSFVLGLIQAYIWGYVGCGVWWLAGKLSGK